MVTEDPQGGTESEERFRTILEHAPVMIDAFAPDGTLEIWNRECERRLGWTAEEIDALEDPLGTFYPDPKDQARVLAAIERADGQFREYKVVAKDGSTHVQMWADFELPNGSRISVGHDVTEQRQIEASLRQSQKMQALGTLSGGIAHDFNNLLTIILGGASMALLDLEASPEAAREALLEIEAAAQRGADLVRRLMSFSRRGGLRRRPLALDETISGFVPTLRRLLPESLALEVDLQATDAQVLADPVAVEQVLLNLVSNARDATEGEGRIRVRSRLAREGVIVEVVDDGRGMSAETQERVFEPFFTTKEAGQGTGLGLPMVYGLIQQHDGSVEIASALGEGTTVELWLPTLEATAPEATLRKPSREDLRGHGETILIVEDDAGLSLTASRCLQRFGYVVLTAPGGAEALEVLDAEPDVDLVLSDVVMPGMGGRELQRQMQEGAHASVPIVFMSGYASPRPQNAPLLPKPWTPDALAAFVRDCLDARAHARGG